MTGSALSPDLAAGQDRPISFCHDSGGELEQIQFLLGHVSVQTTEKYLGTRPSEIVVAQVLCGQAIFEVNPVARHYGFVEGQPRFRAVPANEVIDGTPMAALRFR